MNKHILSWVGVALWCALIFFLSSQPHLPGPEDSTLNFLFKKAGHITAYGILFFLTHRVMSDHRKKSVLPTFLFCIAYAITDELHQSFVPGRSPTVRDVGIDTFGMILSLGIEKGICRMHQT